MKKVYRNAIEAGQIGATAKFRCIVRLNIMNKETVEKNGPPTVEFFDPSFYKRFLNLIFNKIFSRSSRVWNCFSLS